MASAFSALKQPSREDRIAAAKKDGSFHGKVEKFNFINRGKLSMDNDGNINQSTPNEKFDAARHERALKIHESKRNGTFEKIVEHFNSKNHRVKKMDERGSIRREDDPDSEPRGSPRYTFEDTIPDNEMTVESGASDADVKDMRHRRRLAKGYQMEMQKRITERGQMAKPGAQGRVY